MLSSKAMSRRHVECFADAVGHSINSGTLSITRPKAIAGPLGLRLPLAMNFSHACGKGGVFSVASWKVAGDLYIAVAKEEGQDIDLVMLLDKSKIPNKKSNLASMVAQAEVKGQMQKLDDYVALMRPMIFGAWRSSMRHEAGWSPVEI